MKIEKLPFLTICFSFLILFNYLRLTNFSITVSPNLEDIIMFASSHFNPLGIFTYFWFHLWSKHLVVNLLMLTIFGFLLESSISKKKFFVFYISSGVIVGLISFFLSPYTPIIGASGVTFALFGAAMVCRPIRSLLALFILSLLIIPYLVDPLIASFIQKKEKELVQTTQKMTKEIQESQKKLEELKQRYVAGNVSKEVYENTTEKIQIQIKKLNESIEKFSKEKEKIEETKKISITFPVAEHLHIVGMWVGILLVLILEPNKIGIWNRFMFWLVKKSEK